MSDIDWGQLGKSLIGQSDEQVLSRETSRYEGPGTKVKREGVEKFWDAVAASSPPTWKLQSPKAQWGQPPPREPGWQ